MNYLELKLIILSSNFSLIVGDVAQSWGISQIIVLIYIVGLVFKSSEVNMS